MQTTRGIPTRYAGIQFRSRAEARWAAFFDSLGWHWEYEPLDLDGYIPDFVLGGRCIVEVKGGVLSYKDIVSTSKHLPGSVELFLPAAPFTLHDPTQLGSARRKTDWKGEEGWCGAYLGACNRCRTAVPVRWEGPAECLLCGSEDANASIFLKPEIHSTLSDILKRAWAKACNTTQWRQHR